MGNVLLAAASGVLCGLMFPPWEVWLLGPVALVPLLWALGRTKTLRAAVYLTLLFGMVFCGLALPWMLTIFPHRAIGVWAIAAAPWGLFGLVYRYVRPRLSAPSLVLLAPVLWTAVEWIRCQGWYFRFSWLQLGTAYASLQGGQSIYPLVGVYGMTFLTVLVNAAVVAALRPANELASAGPGAPCPPTRTRLKRLIGVAALLAGFQVASVLGIGQPQKDVHMPPIRTLLVQKEEEDLDWLVAASRKYTQPRPQLIAWPEMAVPEYLEDTPEGLATVQRVARSSDAVLIVGCKTHAPPEAPCDWLRRQAMMQTAGELFYNSALVIGPDGHILGRYHKRHPVQFFADGVPGEGYPVFATPIGKLGVAICYDLDFADVFLNLVRNGAELLVVPTYDARSWGPVQQTQHARMAQARAAEVGRYVVRPTSSGLSQILDPGGKAIVLLEMGPAAHTLGIVERRTHLTPYVRGGWVLPYVCLVVAGGVVLCLFVTGCGKGRMPAPLP